MIKFFLKINLMRKLLYKLYKNGYNIIYSNDKKEGGQVLFFIISDIENCIAEVPVQAESDSQIKNESEEKNWRRFVFPRNRGDLWKY